ncbi:MAG: nuclease [Cyanobium sp. LacPavin_0920_WC12_MAG_62_9]|nr:nuclease [Cyanobium sp. LacPavin_0920_WC12_MAG_62_9]
MVGLLLAPLVTLLLWSPAPAAAAEVLQVRSATVLQVGDGNRNYTVELACIRVDQAQEAASIDWLRHELPRRSRVNLRPMGQDTGVLMAKVQKLGESQDLASGLVAAGLAESSCPQPAPVVPAPAVPGPKVS